ncbi:MAG: DsbA family protein [Actinomycetota bacterium]|nr:DsbA family protein [Actinomycetota bacterium]
MEAVVWSDYLCPWCYVGQDRTALLRSLGVTVTVLPFELHPEVPVGGVSLQRRYQAPAAECEAVGMPFRPPTWLPNTRHALAAAEWVRRTHPEAFDAVHEALFRAYFVDGLDIGDHDVVASVAGSDVDIEQGSAWVDESMAAARDADVLATPAWRLDTGVVIPGVQPRAYFERVARRRLAGGGEAAASPPKAIRP